MLKIIGKTFEGLNCYQLSDNLCVSDTGEILKVNNGDIFDFDGSYSTNLNPKVATKEQILNSIVNLENIVIQGHTIDIINCTFDDMPYEEFDSSDSDIGDKGFTTVILNNFCATLHDNGNTEYTSIEDMPKEQFEQELALIKILVLALDLQSEVFVDVKDLY